MNGKFTRWIKAALMVPLMAVYADGGCSTDIIRLAASELEEVADDMDGSNRDIDLGDYLSDLVEDL